MMAISDLFLRKLKKSPGLPEAGQHFKVHKAVMQVETTSYEEICCLEQLYDLLISTESPRILLAGCSFKRPS